MTQLLDRAKAIQMEETLCVSHMVLSGPNLQLESVEDLQYRSKQVLCLLQRLQGGVWDRERGVLARPHAPLMVPTEHQNIFRCSLL